MNEVEATPKPKRNRTKRNLNISAELANGPLDVNIQYDTELQAVNVKFTRSTVEGNVTSSVVKQANFTVPEFINALGASIDI